MRGRVTTARMLRRPAVTIGLLVAVVELLALAVAGPLAAGPGATPKAKAFTCVAKVVSVDVDGRTITAKVIKSNRATRAFVGSEVVFVVRPSAKIIKTGPTAITLADLAVDDRLLIRGRISPSGAFKAALVIDRGAKPIKPTTP